MPHVLQPLPYDYAALEPWIDGNTLRIHHDFHHWKCVARLNRAERALAATRAQGDPRRLRKVERLAAWCAGEHFLHCLAWDVMGPHQGGRPHGELADQIADDFGSFTDFKLAFSTTATGLRAGGWTVLAWESAGQRLAIITFDRRHRLGAHGDGLLLGLEVWPHAYARRYRTRRAEYVHNWWNTVNWPRVAQSFRAVALSPHRLPDPPTQRRDGYEKSMVVDPAAPGIPGNQPAGAR